MRGAIDRTDPPAFRPGSSSHAGDRNLHPSTLFLGWGFADGIDRFADIRGGVGIDTVRKVEKHPRLFDFARDLHHGNGVSIRPGRIGDQISHDLVGERVQAQFPNKPAIGSAIQRNDNGHFFRVLPRARPRNK